MSDVREVLVTASPTAPPDGTILQTPPGDDDVRVVVRSRLRQALIRTVRTYLQALVGFLVAGGVGAADPIDLAQAVGVQMPTNAFFGLLISAAGLAVAPAVVSFIQNMIELLTALDKPQIRA